MPPYLMPNNEENTITGDVYVEIYREKGRENSPIHIYLYSHGEDLIDLSDLLDGKDPISIRQTYEGYGLDRLDGELGTAFIPRQLEGIDIGHYFEAGKKVRHHVFPNSLYDEVLDFLAEKLRHHVNSRPQ